MKKKAVPQKPGISRNSVLAIGVIAVIVIIVIAVFASMPTSKNAGVSGNASVNASDPFTIAGALYSKSVDLANAGNYKEALQAADLALEQNASPLIPIIQANRAGILVMLGRNEEAIAAADVAINAQGNLTGTHSIAYYNKGNALRALGNLTEAEAAYQQAYALNPGLKKL
ncbi:MAG: tetratricopeptide repeat protein [Methanoregula sp.]|jgi:tetratricopeptide (TPR) repeat protein